MKWKKTLIFLLLLLAGIMAGAVIGSLCRNVGALQWLSYAQSIGIGSDTPLVLDLIVMKITFGLSFSINVAQVICIIIALAFYKVFSKGF